MADLRTVAVQVTEDLFSRLKAVLARNGMKQKDFLIGLIEDAIEKEEAKWKAESEEAEEDVYKRQQYGCNRRRNAG